MKRWNGKYPNFYEWCSANSYIGWLHWCDSWRLFEKYVEPVIIPLVMYYKYVILKGVDEKKQNRKAEKYLKGIYQKKGRIAI